MNLDDLLIEPLIPKPLDPTETYADWPCWAPRMPQPLPRTRRVAYRMPDRAASPMDYRMPDRAASPMDYRMPDRGWWSSCTYGDVRTGQLADLAIRSLLFHAGFPEDIGSALLYIALDVYDREPEGLDDESFANMAAKTEAYLLWLYFDQYPRLHAAVTRMLTELDVEQGGHLFELLDQYSELLVDPTFRCRLMDHAEHFNRRRR